LNCGRRRRGAFSITIRTATEVLIDCHGTVGSSACGIVSRGELGDSVQFAVMRGVTDSDRRVRCGREALLGLSTIWFDLEQVVGRRSVRLHAYLTALTMRTCGKLWKRASSPTRGSEDRGCGSTGSPSRNTGLSARLGTERYAEARWATMRGF